MRRSSTVLFLNHLGLALVALALLTRAAIPVGWMPSSTPGVAIMICPGEAPVAAAVSPEMHHHKDTPHHGKRTDHQQCEFAGFSAALDVPSRDVGPPIDFSPDRPEFVAAARGVAVGSGLAAPPPPSTGPPMLI